MASNFPDGEIDPNTSDVDDYPDDDEHVDGVWPEEDRVALTRLGEAEAELEEIRAQMQARRE